MISPREQLKKIPFTRSFGRWFRRTVLQSKYIYLLSTTTKPLSNQYGFDRGVPLDRHFIEKFLQDHKMYIKGACLEVHDGYYTKIFGQDKVEKSDVLDIDSNNVRANIIDDLRHLVKIPDNIYDCIILTQVFQFIDDLDAAVAETYRILKPGGVLLATLPSLSRADCASGETGDFWRFTQAGAKYLLEKRFASTNVKIGTLGNARSGLYFYAGLAVEDCPEKILNHNDTNFPTIVTVLAKKS